MNNVIISLVATIVLALIGVVGDYFIKISTGGKKFVDPKWFIIGFSIYALTAFGWVFVMKYIKLSTLGVFYAVSTIFFLTIVSVVYFNEKLNFYELIGIIMAIASIILLGRFA
jgi:multidrug transporter EmrE-like cation transporter